MTGRIARLLAGFALIVLTVLVPSTADALGPDCKEAPTAEAPGSGIGGWFIDKPDTPPTGDSWVNGAPSVQHYGYAGLHWNTYDLGCGSDLARNPGAVIGTEIGNWLFMLPKTAVGLTNFVVHYAFNPTFLDVFNPLVVQAMTALRNALFNEWAGVFLAFAGVMLLWKFRKMRISSGYTMVGWALLVFTLAAAVFQWPLAAGQTTDKIVTGALGSINRGINGSTGTADPADEVAQNLTSAILYQQWKTGEFGDANSLIAEKYAKDIWESQTLTWADKKLVEEDPDGAGKRLLEFKANQFEDTADKIKDEDPVAYEYLTGKRGEERFGAAFLALFAAVVACPFLLVSSLLILGCFMLVRFAVIFFPAIATLSVAYQFRSMLKGLLNAVAAAVVNTIVFGAGASVTIMAIGVLLAPANKMPIMLRLVLVALVTFIMWVVLKPFRKLTQMVGKNHDVFGGAATALSDQTRGMQRQLVSMGKQAIASYAGNKIALRGNDKRRKKEEGGDKVAEETPVMEPEVTAEETTTITVERVELPQREPAPEVGVRPSTTEPAPYERPAASTPEPVEGTPAREAVATRPAVAEIGPYAATQTGGAVVPVTGEATPPGADTPVVDRPEYAGGTVIPEPKQARSDVWNPGDPEPARPEGAALVDLHGSATIDENGQEVWPVYSPDNGITFDDARTEAARTVDQQNVSFGAGGPQPSGPQPGPQPGPAAPAAPAGGGE